MTKKQFDLEKLERLAENQKITYEYYNMKLHKFISIQADRGGQDLNIEETIDRMVHTKIAQYHFEGMIEDLKQ